MQAENDKNTQQNINVKRFFYFLSSCSMKWIQQIGSPPTKWDSNHDETQKKKKDEHNRVGQWHVITPPQISWQHVPPRCLLRLLSSSLSDSAVKCTCILMLVSPICQSAHSPIGENSASTTGMEQASRGLLLWQLSALQHQTPSITPTASTMSKAHTV